MSLFPDNTPALPALPADLTDREVLRRAINAARATEIQTHMALTAAKAAHDAAHLCRVALERLDTP